MNYDSFYFMKWMSYFYNVSQVFQKQKLDFMFERKHNQKI